MFLHCNHRGGRDQADQHFYNIIHDNREYVFKPMLQLILWLWILSLFFFSPIDYFHCIPRLGEFGYLANVDENKVLSRLKPMQEQVSKHSSLQFQLFPSKHYQKIYTNNDFYVQLESIFSNPPHSLFDFTDISRLYGLVVKPFNTH